MNQAGQGDIFPSSQAPRRVVSLTPSNTEILAFLRELDRLVGVDDWSDWPPAVEELPKVGPDLQIDLDAVADLEPDLVLASLSVPGQEAVVEGVARRGWDHLVLAPKTIEAVCEDLVQVAEVLGVPARGDRLAAAIEQEVARLRELTCGTSRRRVYWEWWPKPAITAGGVGWMTEVLDAAGATNVFGDRQEESPKVTLDEVRAAAPDVVGLCWQGALHPRQDTGALAEREGWQALEAVKQGEVLTLPEELYGRPGPRLVEGIRHLATELHPDLDREALGKPYAWLPPRLREELADALLPGGAI